MTETVDDGWLEPIDLMVDSDAPEQIALDLARRHALYLREAQRLVVEGLVPDESGLADGIRARRPLPAVASLGRSPHTRARGHRSRRALAGSAEGDLGRRSGPRAGAGEHPAAAGAPAGVAAVRHHRRQHGRPEAPDGQGLELSWDSAANVTEWTIRVSVRPDPRQDYVEGDAVALPPRRARTRSRSTTTRGGSSSTATPVTAASSAVPSSRP